MEMTNTELKTAKGMNYINLALLAFAGLASEAIYAYGLEPLIYQAQMSDWTISESIIHWIVTCITWGFIAYGLINFPKKHYGFDLLAKRSKVKAWQWILTLLCIILSLYVSYNDWGGFKPWIEYQHNGCLKFIFQYIYYFFETLLFSLVLIYGQKACELWFKNKSLPYGGIIVGLTWGLAHILSKGNVLIGLLGLFAGFSYGVVYLLLNRNFRKTFPVLYIMFIL